MSPQETAVVLAKVRLFDNREVTPEVVRLWADTFAPVRATVEDAVEALHMFAREQADAYLRPAHIITNIRRIHEARLSHRQLDDEDFREAPGFIPDAKPANFDALTAAWDDPVEFARQTAIYRAQLADDRTARTAPRQAAPPDFGYVVRDITEPVHPADEEPF